MKNLMAKFSVLTITIFVVAVLSVYSQENINNDTIPVALNESGKLKSENNIRKNSILINATNPAIISLKFFTLSYERVLPNNQSFTVSVGSFSLPRFLSDLSDSLGLNTNYSDKGFHFSTDYRFYLKKENKYNAPRGVYIGPYYAYNHLTRGVNWYLDGTNFNGEVLTDINMNIHTLGFELGYQFVFWDRLAIDMILFGPGFGSYKLDTELKTTLSPDQESEFFQKLNDYLSDKIPGYDWIVEPGEFKTNGRFNTWDLGYRYSIRIGYRF